MLKCCSKEDQNRCCPLCHAERPKKKSQTACPITPPIPKLLSISRIENSKHGKQNNFCAHSLVHRLTDCVFSLCRRYVLRYCLLFTVVFLAVVWVCFFFAVPEAEVFSLSSRFPLLYLPCRTSPLSRITAENILQMENVPTKKTVQSKIFQFPFFTTRIRMRIVKVTGKCRHENADQIYRMKNNFIFPMVEVQRSLP